MGFSGLHTGRNEPTYIENLLFARCFVFEVFPPEYYSSFSDVKTRKKTKTKKSSCNMSKDSQLVRALESQSDPRGTELLV